MANNGKTSVGISGNTITTLSNEQRAQVVQGTQLSEVIQTLYSLVLFDTATSETLVAPDLDPAKRTQNAEYFFRVPPKVHEFDEPFATSIVCTQDAGKFVESYGSILKSLRISGTTGFRPNKVRSGTIPLLGISDDQIQTLLGSGLTTDVRRLSPREITGHDDIIFLRNIFRKYSDIKHSDELSSRVLLLWRNLKDADYWIVEPEDFRLSQNSASPLTYEYNISLKTLGVFNFSYTPGPDPLAAARDRQRLQARLQEYSQNLLNMFLTISNRINSIQGYTTFVSNTVLSPLLAVINGLNAVKTSAFGVHKGLRDKALTLVSNVEAAITELSSLRQVDQDYLDFIDMFRSLNRVLVTGARVLSEDAVGSSSVSDVAFTLNRMATAYEAAGTITSPRRSPTSSPSFIGLEPTPVSTGSIIVAPGEGIRDIAARVLNDRARWRILVALNRLRYPYISDEGLPDTLGPGDVILFPTSTSSSSLVSTQNASDAENLANTQGSSLTQLPYGRDLRLRSQFVGSQELTDVIINQRGDLSTVAGVPNVEQAVRIKFATEQGELPAHTYFGTKIPIGRKLTQASVNQIRLNALGTLLSDTRVLRVSNLDLTTNNDILALSANVQLTESHDTLSTSFALRRR